MNIETEITLKITLNSEERQILAAMMQNPMCEDEDPETEAVRRKIFDAVKEKSPYIYNGIR